MSRILQALKQLDAQPAADAGAAPTPPPAAEPLPDAYRQTVPLSELPKEAEPNKPRRKKQRARRARAEEQLLDSAAEIAALLTSLGPSVIECWSPEKASPGVIVQAADVDPQGLSVVVDGAGQPLLNLSATGEATQTEIELRFRSAPRRRRSGSGAKAKKSRSGPRELDPREEKIRALVRGPKTPAVKPPSAWEVAVKAELAHPQIGARYRKLVERWRDDARQHQATWLLVASLGDSEAAAEVLLRAAMLLAESSEENVLVIDADEQAHLTRRLGIAGQTGLTDLLHPEDMHGEPIHSTATTRLHVLPRGRNPWPATATVSTFRTLADELARSYGWLLVAGGSSGSPGMDAIARTCQAAYVVAPLGKLTAQDARQSLRALQATGARVLGSMVVDPQ